MENEIALFLSESKPVEKDETSTVSQFLTDSHDPSTDNKEESESYGTQLLKGVAAIGEFIDRFSGAPTRKALEAGLKGQPILKAFGEQFGEPSELAPTGKDIAAKQLGLSTEETIGFEPRKGFVSEGEEVIPPSKGYKVSPAGIAGLGIDIAADPLAFLPIGKIAKGIKTAGVATGKVILKGSAAAADLALGTDKISKTGEIVGRSIDDITKSLKDMFSPGISKDFEHYKNVASKNNIDTELLPESIEFGKDSFIDRATRQRRELGGKSLEDFKEVVKQTSSALDNQIKNISGTGDVLDKTSAGALIRDAYDRGVQSFFDSIDVTYNSIIKENPGLKISDEGMKNLNSVLNGIEKFAKGRVARGSDPVFVSQGKRLLKNVQNIRNTNGSFKQAVETLREIGEIAYTSKNVMASIPADTKKMRDIYTALTNALIDTTEKNAKVIVNGKVVKGGDLANNLILNNARITDLFGDKSVLKRIGDKNLANEVLFDNLIFNGDSRKVEALRNIISPEDFNQLKGTFLNEATKVNQEGNVLFRSTYNTIEKKKNIVKELLNPEEIKEFGELLDLGDAIGIPVLSTSGTGASNVLSNIVDSIKNVVSNDMLIENLKAVARGKKQLETIERLTKDVSREEAKAIIKRAKLPKKVETAAINRLRFIEFGKPIPIVKASQVYSVQERQYSKDQENKE